MKSMLTQLSTTLAISVAATLTLNTIPAQAVSLAVSNAGFEDGAVTGGVFSTTTPPSWQLYNPFNLTVANGATSGFTASLGTFIPPAGLEDAPEGQKVGFTFLNPTLGNVFLGLQQTLTETLSANSTYNLNVDVGNTLGNNGQLSYLLGFPGYQVQLLAGSNVIATDNNSLSPSEGKFLTSTVSYTVLANNPYLGQPLGIRLVGLNGSGAQVDFDNVRLNAEPVPEPTNVLGLLIAGGIGAVLRRRVQLSK